MQRKMTAVRRARRVIGWILFGATMAAGGQAAAGDLARPEVIGFSIDGRYVAFEEYGAQDGSGYPYASIYVIDVAANDWVADAPVHVLLNDETLPDLESIDNGISIAREQAMNEAQTILDAHGIVAGETGTTLIHYPHSDINADPHRVIFSFGGGYSPYMQDENLLELLPREIANPECDRYELGPVRNMSLTLTQVTAGNAPIVLQDDAGLPDSRGCATGYRIHSVIVYAPNQPDQSACCPRDLAMLVLVSVASFGFEGPDWRFMGVTAMLNDAW